MDLLKFSLTRKDATEMPVGFQVISHRPTSYNQTEGYLKEREVQVALQSTMFSHDHLPYYNWA